MTKMWIVEQRETDGRWFTRLILSTKEAADKKAAEYASFKTPKPTRVVETERP